MHRGIYYANTVVWGGEGGSRGRTEVDERKNEKREMP